MAKNDIDDALVRRLAVLLEETGLTEIEYGTGTWRIRVAKHGETIGAPAAPAVVTPADAEADADSDKGIPPGAVTSPMVGTVYLAPEPGAAPFVSLGDSVEEGQTLLLVEAMKTFNEIRARQAGKVTEILVEDHMPVEFGATLMILS